MRCTNPHFTTFDFGLASGYNSCMKRSGAFKPRPVDRAIFAILAILIISSGAYVLGPWYLSVVDSNKTPLYALMSDSRAVMTYGLLLCIDGLALLYSALGGRGKFYSLITGSALLAGFLLRLYALIGLFLTLDSWRPPSYLSHIAVVCLLGIMWVWVKVSDRTIQ